MIKVIREEPPKHPHQFSQVRKNNVWTTGGSTQSRHTTYGHCLNCGKQYLSPHDLYTECREALRKELLRQQGGPR